MAETKFCLDSLTFKVKIFPRAYVPTKLTFSVSNAKQNLTGNLAWIEHDRRTLFKTNLT